jgi:hypothetical protein
MAEIFTAELKRFQGYRCVCGKQVSEESEDKKPKMFMCCQGKSLILGGSVVNIILECHLVTHNACTNQILHPCLPACFDETQVHDAFIRMFASLLYNYRNGFVDSLDDKSGSSITANDCMNTRGYKKTQIFSKDKFIKNSDKDTRVRESWFDVGLLTDY